MGIFDFLKPKKPQELPLPQQRWNKMWDLWADGELDSPYASLMTYQSEVNNGGHDQYFFNTANAFSYNNYKVTFAGFLNFFNS